MKAPAPVAQPYRNQFWFRAPLLLLVPAVLLVTFFALRHKRPSDTVAVSAPVPSLQTNWQTAFDLSASASPASRRVVFPYSVIPGGVRDANELHSAAAKDSVVAEHYSDFRIARAHTIRLDRPTAMFVSYRMNNHVYWTRNRMTIPAGETLISDGESYARVRCGNRLSPVAALPVSISEPPAEKLESPDFVPPLLANLMPAEEFGAFDPLLANMPGFAPPASGGPVASGVPPVGFPPIFPPGVIPPSGNTTGPPSGPPTGPPTGPPGGSTPPVATPEPGSLTLLLCGAFLFGALWAFFRITLRSQQLFDYK